MKTGKSLVELATEIERQAETKRDFVADTRKVEMNIDPEAPGPSLILFGKDGNATDDFGINNLAHRQIGEHVGIPATYYDAMKTKAPKLLATNVNTWLRQEPSRRMVRTLDGNVRAFLSDKYRPLENQDLAQAVLPPLIELGVEVISCEITERRLYIKAVDKRIERDIPKGARMGDGSHHIFDTVSPLIVISNSEVGAGMLAVETGILTKACTNLAVFAQRSMRKYHAGARLEFADGLQELFSDDTKRLTDAALWKQAADVVRAAFEQARFDSMLEQMKGMTDDKIEGDVVEVVKAAGQHFNFAETERKSILKHLIEGADLSRYGLFNAITRTAEDLPDYDRATDFERLGGKVIELPRKDWERIAFAKAA